MSGIYSLSTKELEYLNQVDSDHWKLDDLPVVDTSNSEFEWRSITTHVPIESKTLNTIPENVVFKVIEHDRYILPSQFYIQLQFSITKSNANDIIAPVNPISHALFTDTRYDINGTQIEINDNYARQRALIQGLTNYKRSYINTIGRSHGWALDTPGTGDSINKYNITTTSQVTSAQSVNNNIVDNAIVDDAAADTGGGDLQIASLQDLVTAADDFATAADGAARQTARTNFNIAAGNLAINSQVNINVGSNFGNLSVNNAELQTFNDGLAQRYSLRSSNGAVDTYNLRIPLSEYFSFCRDINTVFRGYNHDIYFKFNKYINSIIHRSNGVVRTINHITIKKFRLWIAIVKPSPTTAIKLNRMYEKFEAIQMAKPITYYPYRVFYRHDNTNSLRWHLGNLLNRPMHLYFIMTEPNKNDQTGDSPSVFKHRNLTYLSLQVDTQDFPERGIECDFTTGEDDYFRAYHYYLECAGYNKVDPGDAPITYNEFKNNYPLFSIDLTNADESVFAGARNYLIKAEMTAAPTQFFAIFVFQQVAYMSLENESIRIYPK